MKIVIIVFVVSMFAACANQKEQASAFAPATTLPQKTQEKIPSPQMHEPTSDNATVKKEVCESGSDVRVLEVHKKKPGCELAYTKYGKMSIVSSGKHGTKHCEDSFDKITKKLEAQKYKCDPS